MTYLINGKDKKNNIVWYFPIKCDNINDAQKELEQLKKKHPKITYTLEEIQ